MDSLRIHCIQADLEWKNKTGNLCKFSKLIETSAPSDLILLPEMFSTGFVITDSMFAEPINGEASQWMTDTARQKKCVIAGSIFINDEGFAKNRLLWATPDGISGWYDKRHLFRMAGEQNFLKSGNETVVFNLHDWKIMPLICYDLRFPVWSRNWYKDGTYKYDILTYHANWPEVRSHAWKSLLIARAIENQAYVIGINRCGYDGNGILHSGNTMVIDFNGNIIAESRNNSEEVISVELFMDKLNEYRRNFKVAADWDTYKIID